VGCDVRTIHCPPVHAAAPHLHGHDALATPDVEDSSPQNPTLRACSYVQNMSVADHRPLSWMRFKADASWDLLFNGKV